MRNKEDFISMVIIEGLLASKSRLLELVSQIDLIDEGAVPSIELSVSLPTSTSTT